MARVDLRLEALTIVVAVAGMIGCGSDNKAGTPDAAPADATPAIDAMPPKPVLKHPSKSGTVAISDDDKYVIMVNPGDDSISIFKTSDLTLNAKVTTGGEPSSVVIAPDNTTAYVANRSGHSVVKVTGIDQASPTVSDPVAVGSEPTGLALTPTGAKLFVAEFAEGSVGIIDTATMAPATPAFIKGMIQHPRSISVTNNGNTSDDDELLVVAEFYGEPTDSANDVATLDKGRQGRIRIYDVATLTAQNAIVFAPFDSGIVPDVPNATSVFTSPNQLYSVTIRRDSTSPTDNGKAKIYVTSVSASPQPPPRYNGNVFPVVYVGDLGAHAEISTSSGTTNLAKKLFDAAPQGLAGKLFLADIVDLAFVSSTTAPFAESNVAYVVSRGSDAVQRVTFDDATGTQVGNPNKLQIDVIGNATLDAGCKAPTGIAISNDGARAFLNCWANHRLGVVDLGPTQALNTTKESFPLDPAKASADRGRRFFFTGRARWSGNGKADTGTPPNVTLNPPTLNGLAWSSCGSCHPDGLSDNITWIFDAGPRQSTSLDGTYSHGGGQQKQRALNWTGIFDEMHDFERNTRGVSGGLGAITTAPTGQCGTLGSETRQVLAGGLAAPVRELQDTSGNCQHDWDDIDAWVKTIRPPKGLKRIDGTKVAMGAGIFSFGNSVDNANCEGCHGGRGWTISRVFWTPTSANNTALLAAAFTPMSPPWTPSWNMHTKQIEIEQPNQVAPAEVSCVIRNIGTFDSQSPLEKKPDGSTAQGSGGYNIPSLYGVSLGAPYLHNGSAHTLDDVLTSDHMKQGNANFNATDAQKAALIAYVLSIDADTPEQPPVDDPPPVIPGGYDQCPASFP